MARITKKIVFLCVFFYQNMGKSISLCTMAVNEGPGIRARGSSSRASWHDIPTFHGDHHEVEHQEELDNDVMRWSRMTRNPPEHLRMISPPLDINNYNNNNKGPFTYYVSRERGGGVRQMLTIAEEGGRGVSQKLTKDLQPKMQKL